MESIIYTNIICRYGLYILYSGFAIYSIYILIKLIKGLKPDINKINEENKSLKELIYAYCFIFTLTIIPIAGWIFMSSIHIPALPSILSKEFTTVECISEYGEPKDQGGRLFFAGGRLVCHDKNNKEIRINYFDNIELGEGHKLVIKYFKYINIGYIDSIDGQDI